MAYLNKIRNLASKTGTGNSVQIIQLIQNRKESYNLKYDIAKVTYYDARGVSESSIFGCPLYLRLLKKAGGRAVVSFAGTLPLHNFTKPASFLQTIGTPLYLSVYPSVVRYSDIISILITNLIDVSLMM